MDNQLKKNVLLKAIEALVTIVASFLQLSIIARSYSPTIVGEYQVILAGLFFVSALSCFGGIVTIGTREIAQSEPAERRTIFSSAFILQLLVSLVLCIVTVLCYSRPLQLISSSFLVGAIMLLAVTSLQLSQCILLVDERIADIVGAAVIAHIATTLGIFFAAGLGAPVIFLVGISVSFHLVQSILLFVCSRAWSMLSLSSVSKSAIKKIAVEMLPVLVMVIATHLYVRIDMIILNFLTNEVVVAQYSAGYLFLDQLMVLSGFMMSALFPNFARSTSAREREYRILYHGIIKIFCCYLVPIALLIAIFSKPLLGVIFGDVYSEAWLSLSVLMLAALFAWMNGPSGTIFLSLRMQYIYMWATLFSLLVNIAGNFVLIPLLGAIGAAVSTVLTELAICMFSLYWIKRETGYLPWKAIELT